MIPNELQEIFQNPTIKKTQFLVAWLFPTLRVAQNITYYQAYIIKRIAFSEVKRLSISAYTRYGKTQCVAIAVALYILFNENKKIKFIGPTTEQAGLIKNYMAELLLNSRDSLLLRIADLNVRGSERLKTEASQKRMTFSNGCEYNIVTAHGKGLSAMGKGGDLVIIDEGTLISREAYTKIVRMLGDDPANSCLIELYNPWDRDTKTFDHSISPRFERITIDYKIGIDEGRTTEEFIQEQREDMTDLEFTVLYLSEFPTEAEDSLHRIKDIERAEEQEFNLLKELKHLLGQYNKEDITQQQKHELKKEIIRYKLIVSCDPADKGLDFTVMMWGIQKDNQYYEPINIYSEPKSDNMAVVGKLIKKAKEIHLKNAKVDINVDEIGIGVGVKSRAKEILRGNDEIKVVGCHFGKSAIKKDVYINLKAENNFRLASLFRDGYIALSKLKKNNPRLYLKLKNELTKIKWDLTSSEKKKIIDPEKSPDYNDSLVFFIWKGSKSLSYSFI